MKYWRLCPLLIRNISDCLKKMDDVHAYYSRLSYLGGLDFDREEGGPQDQLKRLKADRAEILRHVATCLESCDQLVNKISEYNYTIDSRELVLVKDVEFGKLKCKLVICNLPDVYVFLINCSNKTSSPLVGKTSRSSNHTGRETSEQEGTIGRTFRQF